MSTVFTGAYGPTSFPEQGSHEPGMSADLVLGFRLNKSNTTNSLPDSPQPAPGSLFCAFPTGFQPPVRNFCLETTGLMFTVQCLGSMCGWENPMSFQLATASRPMFCPTVPTTRDPALPFPAFEAISLSPALSRHKRLWFLAPIFLPVNELAAATA